MEAHSRSGVQVQLPEVTESLEDTESTSVTKTNCFKVLKM